MMIVSLDWGKTLSLQPQQGGQLCSLCWALGTEGSGAELEGTVGRLLLARPGMWATKMQDPGRISSRDVLRSVIANVVQSWGYALLGFAISQPPELLPLSRQQ